jgi:23S rRNA pseudouridine1911/1915/1917 synthase
MTMINNEIIEYNVSKEDILNRADLFIKNKFIQFSRSQIKKLIDNKYITINSYPIKASTDIKRNDLIKIIVPQEQKNTLTPSELKLEILYENSDLLIINKPFGIVVHPSKGHLNDTIVNALLGMNIEFEPTLGERKPLLVHRLDKDTSGLLLVAKNERAYKYLSGIQKKREIKKYYLAVVNGIPKKKYATIDAPISRNKSQRKKMNISSDGRESMTTYKVLKSSDKMSLLELELHTGRTHQIRVHMQAIGHAVIGDELYGKKSKLANRQMLHAYKLEFTDSINNIISITNEPEKDMKEFIEFYFSN